jgi:hypothetical protein
VTSGDRPAAVALLYASAFALILAAAAALGVGLLSEHGSAPVLVGLVASLGGLLLLGLGVVRRSGRPPSAG